MQGSEICTEGAEFRRCQVQSAGSNIGKGNDGEDLGIRTKDSVDNIVALVVMVD